MQAVLTAAVRAHLRFPTAADAVPGVTAAVVSDRGVWSGAAGVDGAGTTLDPRAMFAVASISKTFTAAEVMVQVAAGPSTLTRGYRDYVGQELARTVRPCDKRSVCAAACRTSPPLAGEIACCVRKT